VPSPDVFASGFETGDFTEWDTTAGTPTIVTSPLIAGAYTAKFTNTTEYVQVTVSEDELYARFKLRVDTEPTNGAQETNRIVHFLGDAGATPIGRCYIEARYGAKAFRMYRLYPSAQSYIFYYDWQINTNYTIEFYFKKHASTGQYWMKVNGSLVCDTGAIDTSGAPTCDRVQFGLCGYKSFSTNVYIDDAVVSEAEIGTHDTTFFSGFETGDFSEWDAIIGSPSITEMKLHCGAYGCECGVSPTNTEGMYINVGHHKKLYLQFEVKFLDATPPTSGRVYFTYLRESTDSVNILGLFIYNDAGTVKWGFTYRSAGSLVTVNSAVSTNPDSDTWYCVEVVVEMSSRDGDAEGSYMMSIDETELNDITQTAIDTDYTGIAIIRAVTYTTAAGGATVYYDCVNFSTVDADSCHAAGADEPPSLVTETDCTPPASTDWLQVYKNCQRVYVEDLSVESGERGIGRLTLPYSCFVERGDLFHVIVEGSTILQGKVVSITKNRAQGIRVLECQTKTARLYGRYILESTHKTYSGEDAGAIAKDLIDYYFDGLFTSDNVNSNTGIVVSDFDCYDQSVGYALEELAKRANAAFYVAENNSVHFFVKGAESSNATFNSTNIVGDLIVDEVGEEIKKVIVKGISGVSGEAGSGIPEALHSDRRITTNVEAQEVAEALLANYGVTTTTKFTVRGFYSIKKGQSAILDMPLDGYDNSSVNIAQVSWNLSPGSCRTNITLGVLPISYEHLLQQVFKNIQEQKVNRISNHSGSDTGDGDPALEYNDILDLALCAEVRVQVANVTLTSGKCGTEPDAANFASIIVTMQRGASGGAAHFVIKLTNSTTGEIYFTCLVYMDNDHATCVKRVVILDDLSDDTILLEAEGYGSTDIYIQSKIVVRQVIKHAHDVTQSAQHEYD